MADPRFEHHPPRTLDRRRQHENLRALVAAFAAELEQLLPVGRERSLALTKVEECAFWGNAAIARQPGSATAQLPAATGCASYRKGMGTKYCASALCLRCEDVRSREGEHV